MSRLPTFDAARTFDATSLTASYQDLGAVMGSPVYAFVIYNTSDVDAQISFDDGANDGPQVPAGGSFDSSRLSQISDGEQATYVLPMSAQVQVKQVTGAGSDGDIIMNVSRS